MSDKQLPEDPNLFGAWLRERAAGHAPGYHIAVYARPSFWLALADRLDRKPTTPNKEEGGK